MVVKMVVKPIAKLSETLIRSRLVHRRGFSDAPSATPVLVPVGQIIAAALRERARSGADGSCLDWRPPVLRPVARHRARMNSNRCLLLRQWKAGEEVEGTKARADGRLRFETDHPFGDRGGAAPRRPKKPCKPYAARRRTRFNRPARVSPGVSRHSRVASANVAAFLPSTPRPSLINRARVRSHPGRSLANSVSNVSGTKTSDRLTSPTG
jgi:hypothetical protein